MLRAVRSSYVRRALGAGLLAAFVLGAACTPTENARPTLRASMPSPRGADVPGPAPRGRTAGQAAALNESCEGCHLEIAGEWRGSLHARSHTDSVYQRAFAIEPLAFCQGCHAPEADPTEPVPDSVAGIGVACVTCHVLGRDIVAGTAVSKKAKAPHPVVRDGRLGATTACAGCHEFEFPDRSARRVPALMQSTVEEHARSPFRDFSCASCHMPIVGSGRAAHRSHAFVGGRDREFVESAALVTARRTSADTVRITIAPRDLGHAFPTGDLFRRLEVSAEAIGAEWQVVSSDRRYLARHFAREASPFGVVLRRVVADDRPLGSPVDVDLALGPRASHLPITWRVAYQRVEHPRSEDEVDSAVEGEIEINSGTLEVSP